METPCVFLSYLLAGVLFSCHLNWTESWGGLRKEVRVFLIPIKKCARIDFQDLFEY